ELRSAGFGVVNTHLQDGIARGTGLLVALNKEHKDNAQIIEAQSSQHFSFSKSVTSNQSYPTSTMGAMALLRQMYYDAQWYAQGRVTNKDLSLEALNANKDLVSIFDVGNTLDLLRADKVADKFDFTVNTFTHILEGYKVADKMEDHGVGASTFSDWWAYKFEVNDAIPYNAAIMYHQGLTVAINSDDGEMIRRLNQEAAKTVKYGGVPEEEAWKMVTINPAKLLRIDDRVGSIKVGKDADVVLWNGHPLSMYSKPEKTLIEGVVYFDVETDQQKRHQIKEERNRLIHAMLDEKNGGGKTQ